MAGEITLPKVSQLIKPIADFEVALFAPIKALLTPLYSPLAQTLKGMDVRVPQTAPTPAELAYFIAVLVERGDIFKGVEKASRQLGKELGEKERKFHVL